MIFTSPAPPLGGGYSQSQSDEQNTDPHGYCGEDWHILITGGYLWRNLSRFNGHQSKEDGIEYTYFSQNMYSREAPFF